MKTTEKKLLMLLSMTLILTPSIPLKPQLNYLVGLNMQVDFMDNGVARATLKQHPFDANGRSLISNSDIVDRIISEENNTISMMLLFFTTNPFKTSYRIHSHSKLDLGEQVFCNTGIPGIMEKLDGAVVLTVDILLNTTSSFVALGNDVYQIIITDYFTLTDPRSWIDVMDLRFTGNVRLLNFSTDPAWAKPPSFANSTRLQWLNRNEVDAPDNYVLTLQIPGVVFSKVALNLRAEVFRVRFSNVDSSIAVNIRNTGKDEGMLTVVLVEKGFEQARKVYLKPGEEAQVIFPIHVPEGEEITVRVFGEEEQLDEYRFPLSVEKPAANWGTILSIAGLILMLLGAFMISLYLKDRLKEHLPPPEGMTLHASAKNRQ